jgi:hypothetical protein
VKIDFEAHHFFSEDFCLLALTPPFFSLEFGFERGSIKRNSS